MKLDRLIWRDLIPMWFFGAMMFTVLLMSGQFLFELVKLVSEGAPAGSVAELSLLLVPGILSKCLPMGMLLGSLLSFGRLSGDSEIVAMRAAGASVERMMVPVAAFGLAISLLTFGIGEAFVPAASKRAIEVRASIEKSLHTTLKQATLVPLLDGGRTVGFLCAADTDMLNRTLKDVTITVLDTQNRPTQVVSAERLQFTNLKDWRMSGHTSLYSLADGSRTQFSEGVWPSNLGAKPPETFDDLISRTIADLDVYSMPQMARHIEKLSMDPSVKPATIANLKFGFWNKIAIPLSALVFGLLGAPLGIRNHRTGAATGFALSIAIIFGYLMASTIMNIFNQGGSVPAWVASFTPVVAGLSVAVYLIHRRNSQ